MSMEMPNASNENVIANMISDRKILCAAIDELLSVYMQVGHPNPKNKDLFIDEVFKSFAAEDDLCRDKKLRSLIAVVLEEEVSKIKKNKQVNQDSRGMPLLEEKELVLPDRIVVAGEKKPVDNKKNKDATAHLSNYEYFLNYGEYPDKNEDK